MLATFLEAQRSFHTASGLARFVRPNRVDRVRLQKTARFKESDTTTYFSTFQRVSVQLPRTSIEEKTVNYRPQHRQYRRRRYDYGDGDGDTRRYSVTKPRSIVRYGLILCGAVGGCYLMWKNATACSTFISAPVVNAASDSVSRTRRDLRHNFNFIADIVEECADAVVCVDIKDTRR